MARESNSNKLSKYKARIDASVNWRKQEQYDELWTRLINLYRGRHYRGNYKGDRLLVNISFSTINTLAPAVSIGRPKILVNPRRPEDGDKAILTEAIINYWWQHYGCQEEIKKAVKDSLIIGHGWIKTGYRFVEEKKLDDIEDTADEAVENIPTGQVESEFIIREDRPFLEHVDPFNIYVDPNATCMENARWIAQKTRRTLNDVKNDERYDYAARKDVTASSVSQWTKPQSNGVPVYTDDDSYCDVWEYYDINTGMMSIFAETGDKFLVKPTKIPYVFGHPFVMLRDYDIPNIFYPMGELEAIEPLQRELNETRTQMMNHRKRYSRKYLALESAFDDFGRQALVSDDDNVVVMVKGNENLNNVIVPMPALINPPEFYNQSSLITNDIDRVSGISEYQRGAIPETTRTAREASIIAEASNARVSEKLVEIENFIAKCASNLIKLAQQYMTEKQTIRIIGTESAPVWLEFDKDYINGEFDFTVEAGSTAPRNEAFRRDMALQMVSAMQPFAAAGLVDLSKLATYVLGTGFGVKNPEDYITPAPRQGGPEGAPGQPGPEGMPPEGQLPPELEEILDGVASGEIDPASLPPEIQQIIGEILGEEAAVAGAEQGMPPEMAGGQGLPQLTGTENLPPEILQQIMGQVPEAQMAQGAQMPAEQMPAEAMPQEDQMSMDIMAVIEGIQNGQIDPNTLPPELLMMIQQMMEEAQMAPQEGQMQPPTSPM